MKPYNYFKENNAVMLHLTYYMAVVTFWLLIPKMKPILAFILFVFLVFMLMYTMTINNYKLLPTKRLGIALYCGRIALKIAFYILIMGPLRNTPNTTYVLVFLIVFCWIEFLINQIYLKYKHDLFYNFKDADITNDLNGRIETKSYIQDLNKLKIHFLIAFAIFYPIFLFNALKANAGLMLLLVITEIFFIFLVWRKGRER